MADLLDNVQAKAPGASGLKQPGSFTTIVGPNARTNNRYAVEPQSQKSISGGKSKK